jgi:type VI secretion system protein ImpG
MFNKYYRTELAALKGLFVEFLQSHGIKGFTNDPDVERLFEGSAFINAMVRQRIDDELPELVQELFRLLWPHYLRPIPSCTTIKFTPKGKVIGTQTIPAGSSIASVPVEGVSCPFSTSLPVDIHPLELKDVFTKETSSKHVSVSLSFGMADVSLSQWEPSSLRLHLCGESVLAMDLYFILCNYLKRIVLRTSEGREFYLPKENLKAVGFSDDEALLPYPVRSFSGYRLLQEYFIFPQKFLYLDVVGLEGWTNRGDGDAFELVFEIEDSLIHVPTPTLDDFALYCSPAINVFQHFSDPIRLDHSKEQMLVQPAGGNRKQYTVFSVDKVSGIVHGTVAKHDYLPFEVFRGGTTSDPVYSLHLKQSPLEVDGDVDVFLAVSYPEGMVIPKQETLSIDLTCTNGNLPSSLQVGDINVATGDSKEFVTFSNLLPPTTFTPPPIGKNLLWKLISHLSLNHLSLSNVENLKSILDVYLFVNERNQELSAANKRRIDGLLSLSSEKENRLENGIAVSGRRINASASLKNYLSHGDLYLFGCVLDNFFGQYASLNSFTHFFLKESTTGNRMSWHPRQGERILI